MARNIAKVAEALGKVKGVVKVIIPDADVRREMFGLEDDVKEFRVASHQQGPQGY